jgi:hypothetical protein
MNPPGLGIETMDAEGDGVPGVEDAHFRLLGGGLPFVRLTLSEIFDRGQQLTPESSQQIGRHGQVAAVRRLVQKYPTGNNVRPTTALDKSR